MPLEFIIAVSIFGLAFLAILFELVEKSVITLIGGLLMVFFGIISPKQGIEGIDFGTLILLMSMMILVDVLRRTGLFTWLNIRLAHITRGKPWLIFILFLAMAAVMATFFNTVSTVILLVPILIALTKGMDLNVSFYIIGLIFFANIGGNLSLIGDPANILLGTSAGLNFNDFIINLFIPLAFVALFVLTALIVTHWKSLRPISNDLTRIFLSHLTIRKIEQQSLKNPIHINLMIKSLLVFAATIVCFIFQQKIGYPVYIIALSGVVVLMTLVHKNVDFYDVLKEVEWTTLIFFAGLFVMVRGVEEVGLLNMIANTVLQYSADFTVLLLIVLWASGFVSAILDNVAFVAIMVPVIFQIQEQLGNISSDPKLLWWALSLGAILGGSGTLIGSSANLVSADIAHKMGVHISFFKYLKLAFPLMLGMLMISSFYFIVIT